MGNPISPNKNHKFIFLTQIFLRILASAATLAAGWLMLTNKETTEAYGFQVDASYNYSPAFKFFAIANLVAFASSVLSLFLTFFMGRSEVDPIYYFYIFLHDLVISSLLIAGCAAATTIAYVGKYGNNYTGWVAICDHFAKFCNRVLVSTVFSYLGFAFYLILTIISARNSSRVLAMKS